MIDTQSFFLGCIAPFMALVVELVNPVNKEMIKRTVDQDTGIASGLISFAETDAKDALYYKRRGNASEVIARTAEGAVEIYSMILTWVGATAGSAPVLVDKFGVEVTTLAIGVWLFVSGVAGVRLFQTIDYHGMGTFHRYFPILTKSKLLSYVLVVVDLAVIAVLYMSWHPSLPEFVKMW